MSSSVYSREYEVFLQVLRETRKEAGLNQSDVAKGIRQTQSFISKCERGERRIDIVELRVFCRSFGLPLAEFVQRFERALRS